MSLGASAVEHRHQYRGTGAGRGRAAHPREYRTQREELTSTLTAFAFVLTLALTPPQVSSGNIVVHYWPGGARIAQRVLEMARAWRPAALPPDTFQTPIRIFLTPDAARFDSITGGAVPDWGAGVALPDSSIIVLPLGQPTRGAFASMPATLRHELAHVVLHRYLAGSRIPRWFDEGYATWAAGELDAEGAWLLRLAFVMRRAPPLDSLSLQWPAQATDARVAYLLSASAVAYLAELAGERGLALMLDRWRASGSFNEALGKTFLLTPGRFEAEWRKRVRSRYGWTAIISNTLVLWSTTALLLLLLTGLRRRHNRAKLALMRAEEIPDDPAYWLAPEESEEGNAVMPGEDTGTGSGTRSEADADDGAGGDDVASKRRTEPPSH